MKMNKSAAFLCLILALSINALTLKSSLAQNIQLHLPQFSKSCTSDNRNDLLEAHINMGRMINDAIEAVKYESHSKEYKEAFGVPNNKRINLVIKRLTLMRAGASRIPMTANCVQEGSDPICKNTTWAYISGQKYGARNNKYIINFCPKFFNATQQEVRDATTWSTVSINQGAVFLHELAHFTWPTKELLQSLGMNVSDSAPDMKRTLDWEVHADGVKLLAQEDPDLAVANADSYHIFMMDLAVRNRTMYR